MNQIQSKLFYPILAVENLTGELPTPPATALRTDSRLVLEVLQYACQGKHSGCPDMPQTKFRVEEVPMRWMDRPSATEMDI